MPDELVTIATFMSNAEAGPVCAKLESVGIRTYLQGGATADILSHVGTALGGVKLQVAADDLQRAIECLELTNDDQDAAVQDPWDCHQCGETVDAGFEVCWSCGAEFNAQATGAQNSPPPVADPGPSMSSKLPSISCPMCGQTLDADATSCPQCGETIETDGESKPNEVPDGEVPEPVRYADELLGRAFRGSIIGIALCPPLLNIYSVMQLIEYEAARRELNLDADWRLPVTYLINAVVILSAMAFILAIY